jgi:predicted O-methyltransferase YrrM
MQKFNFQKHLREELLNLSKPHICKQVIIDEKIPKGWKENGGVLLFIHFGNFFLSGVALKTILNINYTAIASTENFQHMPRTEANFWQKVHNTANKLYSREMFLTNKFKSKEIVSYLQNGNFVGAAIDVAEHGRKHKFHPFKLLHNEIMLQTGPARLARIAKVPLYGMIIVYDSKAQKHRLRITGPYSNENIENSTQMILKDMEPTVKNNIDQLFHDVFHLFSLTQLKDHLIAPPPKKKIILPLAPIKTLKTELPLNFSPRYESQVTSWHPHRGFAYNLIKEHKPKTIVELGVHYGDSYFTFCQACEELELNTKLYGVDHWKGDDQSGHYNEDVFEGVNLYNQEFHSENSTLLRMKFYEANEEFENSTIDLLHIDGSHDYESVQNDFESWLPKMCKGGKILIHDILVKREDFGVKRFWEEISKAYETQSHLKGFGLGIVNC